jgi:acyl transferase domain-containing protein
MGLVGLGLIGLLAYSLYAYGQAVDRTDRAAGQLRQTRQLIQQIQRLQQRPAIAETQAVREPQLARIIEQCARRAGLPAKAIDQIRPHRPRRVPGTVYQELRTDIALRRVGLVPCLIFTAELANHDLGLAIHDLRLVAPRGDEDDPLWQCDLTVGYLIYAPAESGPGSLP